MEPRRVDPPLDRLLATAEAVASRPDVDPDAAREVFAEAARLLDDGLVLDHLDAHDAAAVVDGLCLDLVTADPGAAVRERAARAAADDSLDDPAGAAAAYEMALGVLQL
ncbi:hypothetical protein GCM10028777_31720 [Angustibacter speluncae]